MDKEVQMTIEKDALREKSQSTYGNPKKNQGRSTGPKKTTRSKKIDEGSVLEDVKTHWGQEKAVESLLWLMHIAEGEITRDGIKSANLSAYLNTIKELNRLVDITSNQDEDALNQFIGGMTEETK